jgi:hypothetical protein
VQQVYRAVQQQYSRLRVTQQTYKAIQQQYNRLIGQYSSSTAGLRGNTSTVQQAYMAVKQQYSRPTWQ